MTAPRPEVWIDSHCHLWEGGAELVAEAHRDGVEWLVDIGTDIDRSVAALDRARTLPGVAATVGLHPHDAEQGPAALDVLERLIADATAGRESGTNGSAADALDAAAAAQRGSRAYAPSSRDADARGRAGLVAVGECGLDYYYEHSDRAVQREAFAAQIAWAHKYDLTLVIHSRDAWADTFDVLDAEGLPERTVFHCFTGGPDEARAALDRGAVLSFSGIVSFRNAAEVRDAAALAPASSYLVETDAPYLAPVPNRGKKNRPSWVRLVGEAVAAARGASVAQVAAETTANARRLFRLGELVGT